MPDLTRDSGIHTSASAFKVFAITWHGVSGKILYTHKSGSECTDSTVLGTSEVPASQFENYQSDVI